MLHIMREQAIGLAVNVGALALWAALGVVVTSPVWMPFVLLAMLLNGGE